MTETTADPRQPVARILAEGDRVVEELRYELPPVVETVTRFTATCGESAFHAEWTQDPDGPVGTRAWMVTNDHGRPVARHAADGAARADAARRAAAAEAANRAAAALADTDTAARGRDAHR